ncbi:MAG TPA: efflux RND transporter periplasmic adaptor subunit [Vicinamibacteria bacterium]|jgi:cobalt-zinc-cadmium efflux system membrane fusion protein
MKWLAVLAALSVPGLGCARPAEKAPAPAAEKTHAEDEAAGRPAAPREDGREAAGVVRIEPGMLRDLQVTTAPVETRPGTESAPVVAELSVPEEAYAEVAAPVAARAVRVPVTAGQPVRRGQLLAELESLDLGKARGEYRDALARLELARQALERKRSLARERIAPLREVEEAEAALRSAEASAGSARATLQAMGTAPGQAAEGAVLRLSAPLSGVVIERSLALGQVVEAARTLFRVGDLSKLWLVAHAPERDAVRVAPRSTARVAIPARPGQALSARVLQVGSQVEVGSRTIPVRLEVPNPGGVLRPGMSATVWLPVGEGAAVIAVPAAALQRLDDRWCVFVPREAGTFEVRTVGRGRDLGGEVEIVSGLQAGETVVVDGAFLLKAEAEKARGEGAHHDH